MRPLKRIVATLVAAGACATLSVAQPAPAPAPQAPVAAAPQLSAADAGAFLDGFMPYAMARGDIAGAAVVIVKDGKVLVARGYGFADRASGRRVDVDETLFRQGSVSKLMTWTAVMQLVQAGRLDLDRDVNSYLDFKVPPRLGEPITLRQLMTHTAGFAETYKELMTPDKASTPSLEAYVKRHLPARIYAPGTTVAYSNYGGTLAGYIVQRVSGERFEDYVARHIFAPLDMRHSSFEQPPRAAGRVATGYIQGSGPAYPFEFAGDVPAGGLSASAGDMARFMIAQLGDAPGAGILSPESLVRMHATAFRQIPGLNGMALGFYEENRNGRRIVGHAGDLISFHTDLHLLPAERIGVYIAMNSWGRDDASSAVRRELFRDFLDRYFPAPASRWPAFAANPADAALLAGQYAPSRRSDGDFGTLFDLFGQGRLSVDADGSITFSRFLNAAGVPKHWRETAPRVWSEVGGPAKLSVLTSNGHVSALYTDDQAGVLTYLPLSPWQSAGWRLPLIAFAIAIMALVAAAWPLGAIARLWRGRGSEAAPRPRSERIATRTMSIGHTLFAAGWVGVVATVATAPSVLGPRLDLPLRLLQLVGVVAVAATSIGLVLAARRWLRGGVTWRQRLADLAALAAGLVLSLFALGYHLISCSLNY